MHPDRQLLHYRLVEQIGEGGMGSVWKATDTTLDREVAIKVLPEGFATDADRLARFEREGKLLATLNHPNIAAVYGLHTDGETRFLAMELVEGEDLRQRIKRAGSLALDRLLDIGRQIAAALEAAHASGIVHRDLKPANVMVTPDGRVKVLDFGLAKAVAAAEASGDPSLSPTLTSAGTLAGMILGTAAYMSPEQARGNPADKRSDLWALGCVLFEMLTGKMPFAGDTVSDTLASVLKLEPDWQLLPANTPRALRRLLRRCLEKDVDRRLHDAADARLELEEAANASPDDAIGAGAEAKRPLVGSPWLLLAVAGLAAVAGLFAGRSLAPVPPEAPVRRFFIPVSAPDDTDAVGSVRPAVSPDGSRIAYTASGKLFVRDLDQESPREIPGAERAFGPFWSPDGEWIGFGTARELWRVPVHGGAPQLVCELPSSIRQASWGTDNKIVMLVGGDKIFEVPARGGDPVILAKAGDDGASDFHGVTTLPAGGAYATLVHRRGSTMTLERRTGDRSETLWTFENSNMFGLSYAEPGYILFRRGGTNAGQWALRVASGGSKAVGEPFLVLLDATNGSASDDGTLVYVESIDDRGPQEIVWATAKGVVESTHGEPQMQINEMALSPDGSMAVVVAGDGEDADLWIHDMSQAAKTRLTFSDGVGVSYPTWSPDGTTIFYVQVDDGGGTEMFSIRADGSGSPWSHGPGTTPDVSGDGTKLLFARDNPQTGRDIYWKPLGDDAGAGEDDARLILGGEADEYHPELSPDGQYLAYVSDESGRREAYITKFPTAEGRWQASTEGGTELQWSPAGNALYFEWGRRVHRVEVARRGDGLSLSSPSVLLDGREHGLYPWDGYHVAPKGKRVLTLRFIEEEDVEKPPVGIHIVENWTAAFVD